MGRREGPHNSHGLPLSPVLFIVRRVINRQQRFQREVALVEGRSLWLIVIILQVVVAKMNGH